MTAIWQTTGAGNLAAGTGNNFRNWQLNRLHLRKRGAKNGEKEPDKAFHVE